MREYNHLNLKYEGYKGSIYKDDMFDMEFTNFSLYDKNGKEVFHATLDNEKQYTTEDVKYYIERALKLLKGEWYGRKIDWKR